MEIHEFLRYTFSSIFANMVVIALLVAMIAMAFGTIWLLVHRQLGIRVLIYGGILAGLFIALAAQQFGAIPTTFHGVATLGMATFDAGPILDAYETTMQWLLDSIGYLSNAMVLLGIGIVAATRGRDGVMVALVGTVMTALGGLLGSGGIITFIMDYIGVVAPVVA
jgi:hypothetical protein